MRYSRAFIPTLKDDPKDATMPSHKLMLRAGYARMVGAGIYELLPLGTRVLHKIEKIIRDEMDGAGAQELLMPTFLPSEYFKESGRWDVYGPTLLRIKDRKGGEYHLAPTHEEIVTDIVRREIKSYRQLPLNLYQIQLKYRDEPRPRAGLLRCREFIMKDAYSFDVSEEAALESYAHMRETYHRIFKRLGLEYRVVEADIGSSRQTAEQSAASRAPSSKFSRRPAKIGSSPAARATTPRTSRLPRQAERHLPPPKRPMPRR
ncbi:MAG: hypothetical protein JRF55_04900 [Deltaproteobacteria bacterium]|nr:hypothetical protein [Deltaproteobacteria bacterium]